ncbi:MAG: tetratricopeptide repeat protein [Anaerolineae bacterium]|jgi:tetratricopeptide (TPR) repeat protein|nr:tetratricopeptide repeat protein [Anaerolineae bacterium]
MAGNRQRFEQAVQRANELIWQNKWSDAVEAYRKALQEFPEDSAALMGYAWALFNSGDLQTAAEIYRRLAALAPKDTGPRERLAEILAQQGQSEEAATRYIETADLYQGQGLTDKRIAALENATRCNPHNDRAWADLLKYYQEQGAIHKALRATLWLAHLYQETHQSWAIEVCRQMQRFAPNDRVLGQVMLLLQSGRPVPVPPSTSDLTGGAFEVTCEEMELELDSETGSVTEIARQRALESLAESLFDDERPAIPGLSSEEVSLLIGQAVDAQTRGDLETALSAYERLVAAGTSMPSIHFNLGLLYKEQMRFDDAIVQLERSLPDPGFLLGSHFALGECYQAQGHFDEALEHFLEAVKVIDLTTVRRDQVDDLIRVYEGLAQNLVNTGEPERVQHLVNSLVGFLGQRGWEEEVIKARKRIDSLARSGTVLGLAEVLSLAGSEDVLRSAAMAQEYIRRKKTYSALEELSYSIGKAPHYLPLHSMLAQLYIESGNLESAIEKMRMIAQAYETRGQIPLALATYQQILELSPLDFTIHTRMIEMLTQRGQIDDALGWYLELADAYYQLAQPERAQETYSEALRLAPRGAPEKRWTVRILHRVADLAMQRLDWKSAIKHYQEITRLAPDDERAHLGLMRLYPRIGRAHLAISALDQLLKHYITTQRSEKAGVILEDLIREQPESIPLRFRAAQLYLNMGKRQKALEHLDVLGDLQLEAGQQADAIKTLDAIIALKPANIESYISLKEQLTGPSQ